MDVRAELYRWLEDLPTWQQDLARRLSSTPQLDEGQYAEALNMVIAAFSDEPAKGAPQPRPITLDDLPQRSVRPAPRLVTLGRISGVGLLAEAETLNFAPTGLTVIYGANASGKSTYVRVLKRICRAVDRESEVLSNVFARIDQQNPVQDASIDILVGESKQSHEIDLADPKDVGTAAISVFDAKCAEMYVTQQNAVAYVPTELLLLTRLAATQDRMRADLATEAERLTGRRPDLTEFHADTAVKRALESVSASTDPADLEELATLDDAQAARIRELHAIISAAEWSSARADAQAARQDASLASELAQQIRAIERAVSTEAQNDLQSKAVAAETARAAAQAAAADFADLPLSGVGSEPWRLLWEAARSFVAQHGGTFPPVAEDACPLCLQTIASDTAETLTHFEAHVHSSVQERVNRTAAEAALELVAPDLLAPLRSTFLAGLADRAPELHAAVTSHLDDLGDVMTALHDDPTIATVQPHGHHASQLLDGWAQTRADHADTLLASDDPVQAQRLREELRELEARKGLGSRTRRVSDPSPRSPPMASNEHWRSHSSSPRCMSPTMTAASSSTTQCRLSMTSAGPISRPGS